MVFYMHQHTHAHALTDTIMVFYTGGGCGSGSGCGLLSLVFLFPWRRHIKILTPRQPPLITPSTPLLGAVVHAHVALLQSFKAKERGERKLRRQPD